MNPLIIYLLTILSAPTIETRELQFTNFCDNIDVVFEVRRRDYPDVIKYYKGGDVIKLPVNTWYLIQIKHYEKSGESLIKRNTKRYKQKNAKSNIIDDPDDPYCYWINTILYWKAIFHLHVFNTFCIEYYKV